MAMTSLALLAPLLLVALIAITIALVVRIGKIFIRYNASLQGRKNISIAKRYLDKDLTKSRIQDL